MTALLKRIKDPVIHASDAWVGDPFERRQEGEILSRLISTSVDEPLVISLQSPWGSGKTTFLRRLAAHLNAELRIPVIRIDAWKSDDVEDPLATIISEIAFALESKAKRTQSLTAKVDGAISSLASCGTKVILPAASLVADVMAPGSGALARTASTYGLRVLKSQEEKREALKSFRSTLEDSRDLLTGRAKGKPLRPMVLIIDELDRCRPDHAIRMLERVKHHFDIPGITFVIATDHGNLPSAVQSVYGEHVDGELYLRKFFDYEFHLKPPSPGAFAELLVREHLFSGIEIPDYPRLLRNTYYYEFRQGHLEISPELDAFEYSMNFALYSSVFQLSLRDQSQAMTILSAYIRTRKQGEVTLPQVDCLIACLRFGSPDRFRTYLQTGRVSLSTNNQAKDAAAFNLLNGLKQHAPAAEFLKMRFDSAEHDDAIWKNIEKIATAGSLDNLESLSAALLLLRLNKLGRRGKRYSARIARLAEVLTEDEEQ